MTGPLNAALVGCVPANLRASSIAINVLFIHMFGDAISPYLMGAMSDALGPGLAQASLNRCKDATLRRFPEATHWLHLEEPNTVTAAILEFLRDTTPPRAGAAPSEA